MNRNYSEQKEVLTRLFKGLRQNKLMARQNFSCCSSCGSYEMSENWESMPKNKKDKYIGYVFYDRQSAAEMNESPNFNGIYLQYDGFGRKRTVTVGKKIVEVANTLDINVKWDGNANSCVWVDLSK